MIFGRFWLQLGAQNHFEIHPKINPKAFQQPNMEKPKILKKHCILQWFRASGHVELGPKIIKNRADVFQKVASKTMLQLGSILEPTWLDFGRVLAAKFGPN